ncbi:Uncharacterized conserved protein [Janthinobacterium sp. Marseille]|nr:pilus assembly protein TadG-related protein [Janthinobacterium sp. Marseille]ABR91494.1 Uncharacterized conserved protein [Janthinobacterium sp. Marseille]
MKPSLRSCQPNQTVCPRGLAAAHQRGSIVVMAAIAISTVVITLATIDIGYLFFQKRDLQKVADLAALAGAQQLARSSADTTPCSSALAVAKLNANQQVTQGFSDSEFVATCGSWDPVKNTTAPHYVAYAAGDAAPTAVSVLVNRSFPSFFGAWANRNVSATAMATIDAPTAVFSVGSKLLQVNSSGALSQLLVATGVNVAGTSALSYQGLANLKVSPGGLLGALGFDIAANADVGTIKNLVFAGSDQCPGGSCPLSALLDAIGTVGGQSSLINLLGIKQEQFSLPVKLLSDAAGGGLFALVEGANGKFALQADTNALGLATAAIGVANSERALDLGLGTGVLTTQIGIVEPPSIGIGGVGTKAYTGQVRIFASVNAPPASAPIFLRQLLTVDLPITIDLISAYATVTDICEKNSSGEDTAKIRVDASLLKTCVGARAGSVFSKSVASCDSGLSPVKIVSLLNNTITLTPQPFILDALTSAADPLPFVKGQTRQMLPSNQLKIGTAVKAVIANVLGQLLAQGQGGKTNGDLAAALLKATGNSLSGATDLLKTSLASLQTFVGSLDSSVKALLGGSLSSAVINLLSGVGNLVGGLLGGIGQLLDLVANCGLFPTDQCKLALDLKGNQTSGGNTISKVMLALLGLVEQLLQPLDALGSSLSSLLSNLGIDTGQVDVTLIDLKCGGGDNVKLVY